MLKVLFELGRISNLPTVWTNCLAAALLAGAPLWEGVPHGFTFDWARGLLSAGSMSLMYTGGMFLNDAFDREIDRTGAPFRPIPSGRISSLAVFVLGGAQLLLAWGIIVWLGWRQVGAIVSPAAVAATALVVLVVSYDLNHKNNPLSPLLMGLCRVGVYFSVGLLGLAGLAGGQMAAVLRLLLGSLVLLAYLMTLTWFAKREGRGMPPPVPIAVMIAGISLLDGLWMAVACGLEWGLAGVVGFLVTLRLQRFVRGT